MEYLEEIVPLEGDEISKLIKQQRMRDVSIILFNIILFVVVVFALQESPLYIVLVFVIMVSVAGIVISITNKLKKKLEKDRENNTKLLIKGTLENKYISGSGRYTMLYFVIGSRKISVNHYDYNKYTVNQAIEIHLAPVADMVLKIKTLDN